MTNKLLHKYPVFSDKITCVGFNPDKYIRQIAGCSLDSTIIVWKLDDEDNNSISNAYKYTGSRGAINDLGYSPNGKLLVTVGQDGSIVLWKVKNHHLTYVHEIGGGNYNVQCVDFFPSNEKLITGSDDSLIKIWKIDKNKPVRTIHRHSQPIISCSICPNGKMIASSCQDKTLRLFDEKSRNQIQVFNEPYGVVNSVEFHPTSSDCLAAGTSDKKIKIFDLRMMKMLQLYKRNEGSVSDISFHPDGQNLLASDLSGSVKIINLMDANQDNIIDYDIGITSVGFHPSGDYFTAGSIDHNIFIWGKRQPRILGEMDDEIASTEKKSKMSPFSKRSKNNSQVDVAYTSEKIMRESYDLMEKRLTFLEDQFRQKGFKIPN